MFAVFVKKFIFQQQFNATKIFSLWFRGQFHNSFSGNIEFLTMSAHVSVITD